MPCSLQFAARSLLDGMFLKPVLSTRLSPYLKSEPLSEFGQARSIIFYCFIQGYPQDQRETVKITQICQYI